MARLTIAVVILSSLQISLDSRAASVISDATFSSCNWSATVYSVSGGAIQASLQFPSGGNPGFYRQSNHGLPANSSIGVFHRYSAASYNPAVEGEICSLDYQEDRIQFAPPFAGATTGANPALIQNGVIYFGPDTSFSNTTWTQSALTSLTATDFTSLSLAHPDFSAVGGSISFGFARRDTNSSASGYSTTHGIDNWSVNIRTLPAGDCDHDCDVDFADYDFWKSHFGDTSGIGLQADDNGNGIVDAADFTVWRDNLEQSNADSPAAAAPEPSGLALFVMALAGLRIVRTKRGDSLAG
jgi:hypothetical protein